MTTVPIPARRSGPSARTLRLLANLAPGTAVIFGLIAVWVVVGTMQNFAQPMSPTIIFSIVLGTVTAVLAGLTAYRLGVEIPRILRGWEAALRERSEAVRAGAPLPPRTEAR